MGALERYSTSALRPRQRVDYWNELCSSVVLVATRPYDLDLFEPSCTRTETGDLHLCELHSSPSIVEHTSAHAARAREPIYFLLLQVDGSSVHRQGGREAHLERGDFTLIATERPYQMIFDRSNTVLSFALPEPLLLRQMPCPQNAVAVRMRYQDNLARMLSDFAGGLWQECRNSWIERVGPSLSNALLALIGCAYAGQSLANPHGSLSIESRRFRVLCYIEEHLRDSALDPAAIAAHFKMSPRSLHMLFSSDSETVCRHIWRRRLEESARTLSSPLHRARTISDIAFDCGFSSSAHFCKVFRQHFGVTPTEYRRTRLCAPDEGRLPSR